MSTDFGVGSSSRFSLIQQHVEAKRQKKHVESSKSVLSPIFLFVSF